MTDVLATLTPKLPTGSAMTPLVERLSKHADVNRHGQTASAEFSGLLDALTSAVQPPRALATAAMPETVPGATASAPDLGQSAPATAREAAKRYDKVAAAKER